MLFIKDGYAINVQKYEGESMESLNQRGYFIVSQKPQTDEEYKKLVVLSKVWMNHKIFSCSYDDEIMEMIINIENDMYD